MSTKLILVLGAMVLLVYAGISYALRHRFPRLEVAADTALKGRVSAAFHVRRTHSFFLNGNNDTRYDFGAFTLVPGQESRRQGSSLSEYLHVGDSISKRSHSVELTVRRGQRLSRWMCLPEAAGQ